MKYYKIIVSNTKREISLSEKAWNQIKEHLRPGRFLEIDDEIIGTSYIVGIFRDRDKELSEHQDLLNEKNDRLLNVPVKVSNKNVLKAYKEQVVKIIDSKTIKK